MRNDGDLAIANELFANHEYRLCDEIIKKATHSIIDVGGHIGCFALYASLLNPQVPIFSFEPHEGNYSLLKQNLKDNHAKNVFSKQLAIGKEMGEIKLMLSQEHLNHSTIQPLEPTGLLQNAHQTTLEKIFERNRLEGCDLIKMDCEGAEFDILYHAADSIFQRTKHLFLEYHEWLPGQTGQGLREHLMKKGYKVEIYPNMKIKELGFLWCYR